VNERIIYPNEQGGISVIIPCVCGLSVRQIAKKDVPEGVKYRIVDLSDIPVDRSLREVWTADFSTYDGIGGESE
jgi:hypothetical protein